MRLNISIRLIIALLTTLFANSSIASITLDTKKQSFNQDWLFAKGELKDAEKN
jgi:hypothetical protein